MTKDLKIHGSIFLLLMRFVENVIGPGNWLKLISAADIPQKIYSPYENYPLTEMEAILQEATKLTGLSISDLKEKFGENMVPDLLAMYKKYLQPGWKTFEVLVYTEMVMHKAARKEDSNAHPPVLNISRVHDKLLMIDYYSERKMGYLAVGIIRGIARYFNEEDKVRIVPLTSPNDLRVQIRVEFD